MLLRLLILTALITTLLTSCKESNDKKLNGGYSWWSGPFITEMPNKNRSYLITGVTKNKNLSEQWIAQVEINNSGTITIENKFSLNTYFRADEHNSPAVLITENNTILIASTGHNEKNKIYIYAGINIHELIERELLTPSLATYVQLIEIEEHLILFSRLSKHGYSYSVSDDQGETWSDWQALFQSGYVKVQKDHSTNKLHFFIGSNPATPNHNINYINAYFDGRHIIPNESINSFNLSVPFQTNREVGTD